jgi:hypothetical protein
MDDCPDQNERINELMCALAFLPSKHQERPRCCEQNASDTMSSPLYG